MRVFFLGYESRIVRVIFVFNVNSCYICIANGGMQHCLRKVHFLRQTQLTT